MNEQALFTQFWLHETQTTRNVLARIPEGSSYRPDPKSRTAHEIAWQIVCEEKMIIDAFESGTVEWNPPPMPDTMKRVLEAYETQSAGMAQRWGALPPERWSGTLDFFGKQRPASPMAWSFLFDIRPSPRPDHGVPSAHGVNRAADLRAKRRRTVARSAGLKATPYLLIWRWP